MTHPVEIHSTKVLHELRAATQTISLAAETPLPGGAKITWQGEAPPRMISPPGKLFELRQTSSMGRGTCYLPLGHTSFQCGDAIGLVADLSGPDGPALRPVIRTERAGSTEDTRFRDALPMQRMRAVRTALYVIPPDGPLTRGDANHSLILDFPAEVLPLELHDLRLFVIPVARIQTSHPDPLTLDSA